MYTEKLEILHKSALRLNEANDRNDVANIILNAVSGLLGFQWCGVGFIEGDKIQFKRSIGFDLPSDFEIEIFGNSITARAIKSKLPQLISNVKTEPNYIGYRGRGIPEMLSELAVPLVVDDVAVGVINIESNRLFAFSQEDKHLIELLSQHVSWALKRLMLIESEKQLSERLSALHKHAATLASASSLSNICQATLDAVSKVLGFEYFAFLIVEGTEVRVLDSLPIFFDFKTTIDGKGLTARSSREKKTILVNDLRTDLDYFHSYVDSLSELTVPIIINDETVALLNAESLKLGAFSDVDQRLMETLAMHVSSAIERLKQLEKDQAIQEEMRKKQLESIGKFSSMIRHDLNTPLQAILNASYLMKSRPELGNDMLMAISKNVEYAQQVVEGLNDIGLSTKLKLVFTDVKELIDESLEYLTVPDTIHVKREYSNEQMTTIIDKIRIRRVIVNLIKNAIEAMPNGGTLTIGLGLEADSIYIRIKDIGVGIPEEQMDKLFKIFHTTKPTGTGLGLAYCKQTVESHNGTIKLSSKIGEGTTVTVLLPQTSNILDEQIIIKH